jgi:hypothetical protein
MMARRESSSSLKGALGMGKLGSHITLTGARAGRQVSEE